MRYGTRYSRIFPTHHPHTETVSRIHKSYLLQRAGHTRVWVSEGQLGERCLSGYRTEKSHNVILLSISIDYTMDTHIRSCNESSEKNRVNRRDYSSKVISCIRDNETIVNRSRSISLIRLIFCSSIQRGIASVVTILSRRYS